MSPKYVFLPCDAFDRYSICLLMNARYMLLTYLKLTLSVKLPKMSFPQHGTQHGTQQRPQQRPQHGTQQRPQHGTHNKKTL